MPFSFSDDTTAQLVEPIIPTGKQKAAVAVHQQPLPELVNSKAWDQSANPEAVPALQAEVEEATSFAVVKQTLDTLEAQGLLMLFDQHEQVAKRLTGELFAAGVLQDSTQVEPVLPIDMSSAGMTKI